jgi:hypothetical protein
MEVCSGHMGDGLFRPPVPKGTDAERSVARPHCRRWDCGWRSWDFRVLAAHDGRADVLRSRAVAITFWRLAEGWTNQMSAGAKLSRGSVTVCRLIAPFVLCFALQATCLASVPVGGPLVGTWRLVTFTDTVAGEAPIRPYGANPIGLFIFTADGHVSISIMRNPPDVTAPTTDPDSDACIPSWFCAYFGTYDVDYQTDTWVTHVLGGNIPGYLGTDEKRHFSIRGDRLVIAGSYEQGGKITYFKRVLVRESGR